MAKSQSMWHRNLISWLQEAKSFPELAERVEKALKTKPKEAEFIEEQARLHRERIGQNNHAIGQLRALSAKRMEEDKARLAAIAAAKAQAQADREAAVAKAEAEREAKYAERQSANEIIVAVKGSSRVSIPRKDLEAKYPGYTEVKVVARGSVPADEVADVSARSVAHAHHALRLHAEKEV